MPVLTFRLAAADAGAAAGSTNENLLTGTKWEFPSVPTAIRVWAVDDGVANGNTLVDAASSNIIAGENLQPQQVAAGTGPNKNEHGLIEWMAMPGQRIQLRVRNTGTANNPARFLVELVER